MLNSDLRRDLEDKIQQYASQLEVINKEEMSALLATGCYATPMYYLSTWNYSPMLTRLERVEVVEEGVSCQFTNIKSNGEMFSYSNIFDNIERLTEELGCFSRNSNLEVMWDMLEIQSTIINVNKLTIQALSNKYYLELNGETLV